MGQATPLAGVKVIELASMLVGPFAAQTLGDLGADVIKVEAPDGDLTRQIGPRTASGMGAFFMTLNRNKKSVVMDLARADDRQVFDQLIEQCDVFLYSVRSAAARRLGIDYDRLHELNPRLIHCQIVGYGENGRYAGRPAYDTVIQAASGLSSLEATVVGAPAYTPSIHADKVCGLYAAQAITASLYQRERTSTGQRIVVPMFEAMTAYNMLEHQWGQVFEPAQGPTGYGPILAQTRRPFPTQDGYISVLPYTDKHWQAFFSVVETPETFGDERFSTFAARVTNQEHVWRVVAERLTGFPNALLAERFATSDIPFSVVNSLDDLIDDPHLADVGFWDYRDHPAMGGVRLPKFPVQFDGDNPVATRLPPELDEHGTDIRQHAADGERTWPGAPGEPGG
jgi:crotonobetainyl-CoA:carnitine CoA-transferase CaiB-like acyl-CoA transferase